MRHAALLAALACAVSFAQEVRVAAASDLDFVIRELKATFEGAHPDVVVTVQLGSSGNFFTQIQQGLPVDLFFSANAKFSGRLEILVLTEPATTRRWRSSPTEWRCSPTAGWSEGSAEDVFARPATPEVAELVGFVNLFPGRVVRVDGDWLELETPTGALHARAVEGLSVGQRVRWGVRPEEVLVVRPGRGRSAPGDTRLAGRLAALRPHGLGYKANVESTEGIAGGLALELHLSRAAMARLELRVGERLEVKLKAEFLHVMLEP